MPSITGNIGSTSQHIPAWKKLGLKLKFAKDLPLQTDDSFVNDARSRKRKLVDDETAVDEVGPVKATKIKRAKRRSSPTSPLSVKTPAETSIRDHNSDGAHASPIASATPLRKRKSVAFTPETKLEDGDSTKQLFYAWVAEQIAKDPSFNPQVLGGAFKTFEPRSDPKRSTDKKVKKSKSKKKGITPQRTNQENQATTSSTEHETSPHPAVTYLQQYHESRTSWKFNKAKQTYILKHLFDTIKLPPSLDPALTAYIEGLQGADACSRVRKAAEAIRDEDEKAKEVVAKENMESAVRRQEDYDSALKHYIAQLKGQVKEQEDLAKYLDPEWRLKFLKRKRAERILWSLGDTLDVADRAASQPGVDRSGAGGNGDKKVTTNDGMARRRRKRRTGVPDDDKSSSSSSSGSSGGSSEVSSSAEGTSSESEASSESEEGTSSSGSSRSPSTSSSSSSSGNSSKDSEQEGSNSDGPSDSD